MKEELWIKLYECNDSFKASILKAQLDAYEIPAVILNKQDSAYGAFGLIEVHVPNTHVKTAEGLLLSLAL